MSSHVTAPATLVPGVSTHRLVALVGVLAVMTGTTAGVAVAGLLALVVAVREVGRARARRVAPSGVRRDWTAFSIT